MINRELIEFARENGIEVIDTKSKYSSKTQYRGLTYNKDINKGIKPIKLQYRGKIGYNLKGEITSILQMRNKVVLVVANAGGGKTYVMMEVASELAKENPNTAYVLIVPNTTQSDQNQYSEDLKQFGFKSIVGKKNDKRVIVDTDRQLFSCVFDKAQETIEILKKAGKEVVLIIDEAHKLIWDTYRTTALDGIEAVLNDEYFGADMVVMMTATPRVNKKFYKFDEIYELKDVEIKNNIKKLKVLYTEDWTITLLRQINRIVTNGKKPLVRLNSKSEISNIMKLLEQNNITSASLTSDNKKDNEIFENIEKTGMIGDTAQVILVTSVIECGISLKATDIVPVEVVRRASDFNTDNTIQFFARPRKEVEEGVLILKKYQDIDINAKGVTSLKDFDWYFNEIAELVNIQLDYIRAQMNYNLKTKGFEYAKEELQKELAILKNNRTVINCIEANYDVMNVYISNKKFLQRVFSEMDKDIIVKSPLLIKKFFKDSIFYSDIEVEVDETYKTTESILKGVVEPLLDKSNKEDKAFLKAIRSRKIKPNLQDIVFGIYPEDVDMEKIEKIKEHRVYAVLENYLKGLDATINTIDKVKELRKETAEAKKLKEEDFRKLLDNESIIENIEAIKNKEIHSENVEEYNLDVPLHDVIELRESNIFKTLTDTIEVFEKEEALQIIKHKTINSKSEEVHFGKKTIQDMCEIKYFIEKDKTYKGLTKYDLIYNVIEANRKNGKQVDLTRKLGVMLVTELVKAKHYNSKEVMKLIREIENELFILESTGQSSEFYTKENIKKLETAISSTLKNKLITDINKIFGIGQSSKGYTIVNAPLKTFDLNKYLI